MLAIIRRWIDRHHLLTSGDKVIVACSGGPDSLALLHILLRLQKDYQLELKVAHVNHMFRPAATEEANYVQTIAAQWGLACEIAQIDVPRYIKETGLSAQEAARFVRYGFLQQTADNWEGAKIATGHHRDDQAETVLLHLLRGGGGSGLGGMRPRNGQVIRPLLPVSRVAIEEYCRKEGLEPVQDESNLQTKYLRNRVRLSLVPQLESEYNPALRDSLWRTSQIIGDEHDLITALAEREWRSLAREDDGDILLNIDSLSNLPVALQREIFRLAIEKKQGHIRGIQFIHVETLIESACTGQPGAITELPGGIDVVKGYEMLVFTWRDKSRNQADGKIVPVILPLPGKAQWGSMVIVAEQIDHVGKLTSFQAAFDMDELEQPLHIRQRRAGEKFQPLGLRGSKKLKDFFIDAKVPRHKRDMVPLVCDNKGILWVAGYRQAERGKITAATRRITQLTLITGEDYYA